MNVKHAGTAETTTPDLNAGRAFMHGILDM
jgi:hypothetical protein